MTIGEWPLLGSQSVFLLGGRTPGGRLASWPPPTKELAEFIESNKEQVITALPFI
jgi:hypothetical protein